MSDDKTIIADSHNITAIRLPQNRRPCLVQYNGASLGKRYAIPETETTIGRSPNAQIVILDQGVSRLHARIIESMAGYSIEDLGTTNGTYVNDQVLSEKKLLQDGDLIRCGTVLLKFFSTQNIDHVFHDKIYRMATIDAGTQIFNKKYLLESLDSEFQFARTLGRPLAFILYDLDFFKKVNDTYGHNAGDVILLECAKLAKAAVRKDDILARYGGEEFCVILPGADAQTSLDTAERIRKSIEDHVFIFEGHKVKQTVSLGVAAFSPKMTEPLQLIEAADKVLYQSKKSGRNRVSFSKE